MKPAVPLPPEVQRTCWFHDDPCPHCDGKQATDGKLVWCAGTCVGWAEDESALRVSEKAK
jgi:hypothetical protein